MPISCLTQPGSGLCWHRVAEPAGPWGCCWILPWGVTALSKPGRGAPQPQLKVAAAPHCSLYTVTCFYLSGSQYDWELVKV